MENFLAYYPLLTSIDTWLSAAISDIGTRIAIWGLLSGALTIPIYWVLSPQNGIRDCKSASRRNRLELKDYDGEFSGAKGLLLKNVTLSFKLLGMVILPTLASSLPIVAMMLWLSGTMAEPAPESGAKVVLSVFPSSEVLVADPADQMIQSEYGYIVTWPADGAKVSLLDRLGHTVSILNSERSLATSQKNDWWTKLAGNSAPPIPRDSSIDAIEFVVICEGVEQGPFIPWEVLFIIAVMVSALSLKIGFKIE
jgi:hypothetical protein